MLVGVEPKLMTILERSGAADKIGKENIFPVQPALFGAEEAAEAAAKAWIARSPTAATTSDKEKYTGAIRGDIRPRVNRGW
jgi:hypothetical protein